MSGQRWRSFCVDLGQVCVRNLESVNFLALIGLDDMDILRRPRSVVGGDCGSIPGWNTLDCCRDCHDSNSGVSYTPGSDLENVNGKNICCHAEKWVKAESWSYCRGQVVGKHICWRERVG